jgi:hypothetical protein
MLWRCIQLEDPTVTIEQAKIRHCLLLLARNEVTRSCLELLDIRTPIREIRTWKVGNDEEPVLRMYVDLH